MRMREDVILVVQCDRGGLQKPKWVVVCPNPDGSITKIEIKSCKLAVTTALFARIAAEARGEPRRAIILTDDTGPDRDILDRYK